MRAGRVPQRVWPGRGGRPGRGHVCFFSRRISEGEDRPLGAGGAGRETARDVDPGWERGSRRAGRGIQRKARRKTEGELEAVEEGKGRRFPFLASAPPAARPGSRRIAPACAPRIPLERGREGAAGWGRALRAPGRGGGRSRRRTPARRRKRGWTVHLHAQRRRAASSASSA